MPVISKDRWKLQSDLDDQMNECCFEVGGFTIKVVSDLPFTNRTFASKFNHFRTDEVGSDLVTVCHHFGLPQVDLGELGSRVYYRPPWAIYRGEGGWTYLGILPGILGDELFCMACFNRDHSRGHFYHKDAKAFQAGGLDSLTLLPNDQILLARLMVERRGMILHASGMRVEGQGLLFVGHSGAGKSTITSLLGEWGKVLCDDRVILRHWPGGLRIHGTWFHSNLPLVSPESAPLRAILLLEQARENQLLRLERRQIVGLLPSFVVRPLADADWWAKTLDLIGLVACQVPVYRLRFERSRSVKESLKDLLD